MMCDYFLTADLQYPECQDWDVLVCYVNTTTDIVVRLVGEETSVSLRSYKSYIWIALFDSCVVYF